jgi:hypothetical protein
MTANRINPIRGICTIPVLPASLAMTQGNIYHVMPYSGSDSNDGLSVDAPLKTLLQAQTLTTANQNDIVLLYSEHGSTTASTTDYQSATLTWAKNAVHLIGVNSGTNFGIRSRLGFISTYDTASNLFTLSGSNCYIANVQFYVGVAGTTPTGCVSVTGDRNHFENCHIAGMGASTNVIASAYSLSLTGAEENLFEKCTIGYFQMRGAEACAELYINAGSKHNTFRECTIYSSANADQACAVRTAATMGGHTHFQRCAFINEGVNGGGANVAYAFICTANPGGTILLDNCTSAGYTDWSDNSGTIWGQTEGAAATGGIGAVLTKS